MGQDIPNVDDVAAANERFYQAFSSLNVCKMEAVWETSQQVICVHPGWAPLIGWVSIRTSWESIFKHANLMHFNITNMNVVMHGDSAWVTCLENVTSVVDGRANQYSVWATNVFVLANHGWRIVHHHGSS